MSGQKANTAIIVAHGVGAQIAFNSSGGAADWVMLMPIGNGGVINTVDKRGPYKVADPAKLASESLQAGGGRLPIDENHATDLAAPQGGPSPARGWATALEARSDGIYGNVEWSAPGAALMSDKAYRFISPVITTDKAGNVTGLLRASLTNTPNLRGMAALNSQEMDDMDLLAQLRSALGLDDSADAGAVIAKVKGMCSDTSTQSIALAAGLAKDADTATVLAAVKTLKTGVSLASIAKAAGLKEDADQAAIVTAVTALTSGVPETVKALQAELATVTTSLNALTGSTAKDKATAFVDGAIREGRVGVKPLRDHYITMHAADPSRVEKEIGAMPKLGATGLTETPPVDKDGKVSLNAEQKNAARLLGIKEEDYAKTLASQAA